MMAYNPFDRTRSPSSSPSLAATQASNTLEDFDPVPWLKKAMDCKLKGVMFHSNASRSAHMMGLQGMKRWHRCQMKDAFKQLVELQHYTLESTMILNSRLHQVQLQLLIRNHYSKLITSMSQNTMG